VPRTGQKGVPNRQEIVVKVEGTWRLVDCAANVFMHSADEKILTHYPIVPF
jgi:hypothetical protein